MTTTEVGRKGEKIAARFLKKNGFRILETNRHQSYNELDIIARNRDLLLFVEVKTRTMDENGELKFGPPGAAVDRKKQARLLQAARAYLVQSKGKYQSLQPRMDVIEVYLDRTSGKPTKIHHIPNAF